ncbi:MAG: hypothetical protein NXY59_08045 [Aigarchaeota archaeon]|nr:hypothetical protein [Candidatus Pelearchaeum maunauluense]
MALRSAGPALQIVLMDLSRNSKVKRLRNMLRKPKPAERDRMFELFGTSWGLTAASEAADSIGGDYDDGGDGDDVSNPPPYNILLNRVIP